MATITETCNKIEGAAKELSSRLKSLEKKIKSNIVNDAERIELLDELDSTVKTILTDIFGQERVTRRGGCFENLRLSEGFIKYSSFAQAVIFNYWSRKGEMIESSISRVDSHYRDNLFYKGFRWSRLDSKKRFYDFFDILKTAIHGDAPIDFFTEYGINNGLRFIRVTGKQDCSMKIADQSVQLPILTDTTCINSKKFKDLIEFIYDMRKAMNNEDTAKSFKNTKITLLESLKKSVDDAFLEAEIKDNNILVNWQKTIKRSFTAGKVIEKEPSLRQVFNVVLGYQYYDHPYDINIFFPSSKNFACLVITLEEGSKRINNQYKKSLLRLADALGKVPQLESLIWQRNGENIPLFWRWKKFYENYYEQYSRLSNVALGICKAICKNNEIEILDIPGRLKEFDSFYNKIVARANGRDPNFPSARDCSAARKGDFLRNYKRNVKNPFIDEAKYIFHNLKDMVGLRIICVYKNTLDIIAKEFKNLSKKREISGLKIDKHKDLFGYRSIHISFSLGKKRQKLYELEDLKDKKCEIQVRTILEQSWDDVSHKLIYKNKKGVSKRIVQAIEEKTKPELSKQAAHILELDLKFVEIRDKVDEYFDEMNLRLNNQC